MKKLFTTLFLSCLFYNAQAAVTNTTIQVTATLNPTCEITSAKIDFGLIGIVTNNATSSNSNLSVKCSNQLAYTIAFSGGNQGNNTMKGSQKGEQIPYALCRAAGWKLSGANIACTSPWVNTNVNGLGNGKTQAYTVYAYVLNGFYTPDNYSDSVVASITY